MSTETWSALPEEILELIFELLTDIFDLLRSRGVCFSWRYVAMNLYPNPTTPLLLLRVKKTSASREYVETISISFGTTPPMVYRVQSIEALSRTRCVYSYRGWLLMETLMIPIALFFFFVQPILLHKGCICKRGDREWRKIFPLRTFYEDMIYYKDAFYAIDNNGMVERFNYRNCPSTVDTVSVMDMNIIGNPDMYLVESSCGELWVVVRQVGSHEDTRRVGFLKTKTIKVFKLTWKGTEVIASISPMICGLEVQTRVIMTMGIYDLASQKIEQFIPSPKILDDTTIQRWFRPGI
ncbi:hypothetical protein Acr_08g0009190 [Actinidia rufa]|uniref:F-box domain-containing protein n=1 Tax=Actinidia rufa TaxID=165716 RepID=A0A7J0F1P6_9ERIC|nr:hypothetical protein Acr_08g0009190 [Actinidia rufa]